MILLTAEQVAHLSHDERSLLSSLVRRYEWLTVRIQEDAERGRPVGLLRLERKALRWAIGGRGVVLPPNPPVPMLERRRATDTVQAPASDVVPQPTETP